jgi:hypothetical protein
VGRTDLTVHGEPGQPARQRVGTGVRQPHLASDFLIVRDVTIPSGDYRFAAFRTSYLVERAFLVGVSNRSVVVKLTRLFRF